MYSQVFPNYVCLPESKYMFKNIQRKQKLIDEQYQHQEVVQKRQAEGKDGMWSEDDRMFNTKFVNSVMRQEASMSMRQYESQAKDLNLQQSLRMEEEDSILKDKPFMPIEDLKMDALVSHFLMKDSETSILPPHMTALNIDLSNVNSENISVTPNQTGDISART
jgi:hypothetical protein